MVQSLIGKQATLGPTLATTLDERQLSQLKSSELFTLLDTDVGRGLSSNTARARLNEFGGNEIEKHKKQGWLGLLVGQFQSSVVILLLVAATISYVCHEVLQAWGILIAVLINAGVGFFMELRAQTSLEALARLSGATVRSRRDGKEMELPVRELVPGDIVLLEQGSRIPADIRFVEAARLSVDESAMTGESVPVWKCDEWSELETEYSTLGFQGTMIAGGRAVARTDNYRPKG